MLAEFRQAFFSAGVARDAESDGWTSKGELVLREVHVRANIPQAVFSVEIPDGTLVSDQVRRKSYVKGGAKTSERTKVLWPWMLLLTGGILAAGVFFSWRRRFRSLVE